VNVQEIPLVFNCQGSELIGIVYLPEQVRARGVLFVVAGGSQYRGGMCRMQVQMARDWAARGVPVMCFDHRGLGDSAGEFKGYSDIEPDLRAALQAFRQQVPVMKEVVMWGGCDAASATLINAWKFPEVTGIVLGNPWVHNEKTADKVAIMHFSQRMRDKDFWLKVLRLQYNPLPALLTLVRSALAPLRKRLAGQAQATAQYQDSPALNHLVRMRNGMQRFKGDVLMLMSGRSLVSQEFDILVADDPAWQQALRAPRLITRHDLEDADQAFSTIATRVEVSEATVRWVLDVKADLSAPAPKTAA
jgi:exosortase A-associated hydrolase 1